MSERATYDPIAHDLLLDETYRIGADGVPPDIADLVPSRAYTASELVCRIAVSGQYSKFYPGWIGIEAARADGRTPWRQQDRYPGLARHNNRWGSIVLVLGAGVLKGWRLVLLDLFEHEGRIDTWILTSAGQQRRPVVFDDQAHAVKWTEELFQRNTLPRNMLWTAAPDGVPPLILARGGSKAGPGVL
jgi:hypothetical protein